MAGKVRLKTRRSLIDGEWTTVVLDDSGKETEPTKRVTQTGLIISDDLGIVPGMRTFHETREVAREAVRKLKERFPNTEYVGGLH